MSPTSRLSVRGAVGDLLRAAGDHPLVRSFPHGALIVFDHDLRYLAVGGLGLAEVGLSREQLEGRTIDEVFPGEVVDIIEPLYRAALRGEESATDVPYEGRIFLQRLAPLRDVDGTVVGGMGFTQDVTETREALRALEVSEAQLRVERRRLEEAQHIGRVGSWEMDLSTGELTWSDAMLRLYGLQPGTFDGHYATALECVHPDDRAKVDAATQACLATGSDLAVHYRVNRFGDGALRWFAARARTLYDGDLPARLAGAVADVTDQVRAEHQAREAQAFYNAVLAASPDLLIVTDLASGALRYSSRQVNILGRSSDEMDALTPEELRELVHPEDRGRLRDAAVTARSLRQGEVARQRYRARHVDGSWRWISRRATPFRIAADGTVLEVLEVVRDETDVVWAEEQLAHAALHDDLTGLPNRSLLIARLDAALREAQVQGWEVAVLFCDLDGFKRVNDTYGHARGDAVLVEAARRLGGVLGVEDTVARVGGDEFVLVLWPAEGSGRERALRVADRAVAALRRPVVVENVEHIVSVSIGIRDAAPATTEVDAEELVQDADTAMYHAKSLGKDRAEVFEQRLRADVYERGRVEQLVREALRGEPGGAVLSAAYQPVVDAAGRLTGFEALARLTDAEGGRVSPHAFIPVAEETGMIHRLGAVMLDLACGQLRSWRRDHRGSHESPDGSPDGLTVAVNVSALQASRGRLEDDVRRALTRHGLRPTDLVLELTETTLLEATPATLGALRRLHDEGIGIAIDDFGTGYASLRYLVTLPVSTVKIDRSFTAGLPHDPTSRTIITAVARLAADLGLGCVVEGVETPEQRALLPPGVGVQGFLIGRPQPADAWTALVDGLLDGQGIT